MRDFSIYAQAEDRWRDAQTAAHEQRLRRQLKQSGEQSLPLWPRLIQQAARIVSGRWIVEAWRVPKQSRVH